jgi:hypothetical protein
MSEIPEINTVVAIRIIILIVLSVAAFAFFAKQLTKK